MADSAQERDEIAKRIRSLRKARGLSLQQLAERADISPGYLSEVERGLSEVSGVKLARLAEHLGVSTDYLLSGKPEPAGVSTIRIPPGLAEAAEFLDLTFPKTIRLLAGRESLVARRSTSAEHEWSRQEWIDFYYKVEPYL